PPGRAPLRRCDATRILIGRGARRTPGGGRPRANLADAMPARNPRTPGFPASGRPAPGWRKGPDRGYRLSMIRLGIALEAAFEADTLAHALARPLEATLGGPEAIVGGLVLATAAAGALGEAVGHRLASRWPAAELVGTSF